MPSCTNETNLTLDSSSARKFIDVSPGVTGASPAGDGLGFSEGVGVGSAGAVGAGDVGSGFVAGAGSGGVVGGVAVVGSAPGGLGSGVDDAVGDVVSVAGFSAPLSVLAGAAGFAGVVLSPGGVMVGWVSEGGVAGAGAL